MKHSSYQATVALLRLYNAFAALLMCLIGLPLRSTDCFDLHYCRLAANHKAYTPNSFTAPALLALTCVSKPSMIPKAATLESSLSSLSSSSSSSSAAVTHAPAWLETLDAIIQADERFFMDTFCHSTARRIITFLANPDKPDAECSAHYTTIMNSTHPVITAFFADTSAPKPAMQAYLIKMPVHAVLVLKHTDSRGSLFKVYESWAGSFSLLNWLSNNPMMKLGYLEEDENHEIITTMRTQYGQGKLITATDIQQFMNLTLADTYKDKDDDRKICIVRQFIIEEEHLDKQLQTRLALIQQDRKEWDCTTRPRLMWFCFSRPINRYFAENPAWAKVKK